MLLVSRQTICRKRVYMLMDYRKAGEPQMHITRIMSRLMRRHHNHMHTLLQDYDVYPGQPPLMFALEREGGQSQNELARHLGIKAATLTIMLNRMEKNGLVRRESDPGDQRVSRIYLTDKGRDTAGEVRAILGTLELQALEGFTEGEKDDLRRLLAKMGGNIARYSEASPPSPPDTD